MLMLGKVETSFTLSSLNRIIINFQLSIKSVSFKHQAVGDITGELLLVMTDEDHRFVVPPTEGLDDILHQLTVTVIQPVEGLVEDQQVGILHKGTCQ